MKISCRFVPWATLQISTLLLYLQGTLLHGSSVQNLFSLLSFLLSFLILPNLLNNRRISHNSLFFHLVDDELPEIWKWIGIDKSEYCLSFIPHCRAQGKFSPELTNYFIATFSSPAMETSHLNVIPLIAPCFIAVLKFL